MDNLGARGRGKICSIASLLVLAGILALQEACSRPNAADSNSAKADGSKPRTPANMKPIFKMPGESFKGALPALGEHEKQLSAELRRDVKRFAQEIGERNIPRHSQLVAAASAIAKIFTAAGYQVERQTMQVRGRACDNIQAEIVGKDRPKEIVVVGAHYDSVSGAPGANDNASGLAGMLALARAMSGRETSRTLRFVAFANEEPPYFQTDQMGSLVYAKRCR